MKSTSNKTNLKFTTCSVVMSVYKKDRRDWFRAALDSILDQTVVSDDIIVVRDGIVSDEIDKILNQYELNHGIKVVRLDSNVGAGEARNVGLRLARNELVAIMDADDISVRNRFELQLAEFNNKPYLSLVGGQIAEFEDTPENVVSYRSVPQKHKDIIEFSKRRSPFNNMTVCIVKSDALAAGGYKAATRVEDYNLWLELLSSGRKVSNLSEVLCFVRINDAAVLRRMTLEHAAELLKLRYKYYRRNYVGLYDLIIASVASFALLLLPVGIARLVYKGVLRS